MKKKYLIYLGAALLALTLLTFGKAPASIAPSGDPEPTTIRLEAAAAPEGAAPVPTPAETVPAATPTAAPEEASAETPEEERILGWCRSILEELPYGLDLDGDGTAETVDLTTLPGPDDCPRWTVSLRQGDQVRLYQTDVLADMPCGLWAGDLDEDGQYELFFHGDLASDDYVIYGFRSDLSCLFFEPDERAFRWGGAEQSNVFDGCIEGFEDGHLVISGAVDMLGTHWGVRTYAIGDDGVIGPVSSVWEFDEDDDRFLTVTRALTAYKAAVRKGPGEAFTLKPGDRIFILASDGCERLWFKTGDGKKTGLLLLTPDEENMWLIDGIPEADYFETLPYAG